MARVQPLHLHPADKGSNSSRLRGNIPCVTSSSCKTTFITMPPPCLTLAQFDQPRLRWCLRGCHAPSDVQHFMQML